MKKIIAFSILFGMGLSSCEKFLEEDPQNFISPENFPVTRSDADMMLAGTMRTLWQERMYDRALYFLAEASTDHTRASETSGPRFDISAFTHVSDNEFIRRAWEACYDVVNNANIMIDNFPDTEMSQEDIDRYTASAKFLRAFAYFHLVRLYGRLPILTEPVEDFESARNMERSPVEDVYAQILQDLEEAESILPEEWEGMDPGRPDLGMCKSLMAEVYITAAGWPLQDESMWARAAEKAREVMDMGRYALLDDFADLWLVANRNHRESIFSLQNMTETNSRSMMSVQTRPGNLPDGEAGWGMWHSYETFLNTFDDQDARKEISFLTSFGEMTYEDFNGEQPYIKKYFDVGREDFFENNRRAPIHFPIFRYAEILLFYAEAENEVNGPVAEAYAAINQVRTRAGLDELQPGLSQAGFREAVRQERSFELAFECKRRYDLVRWDTFMEVLSEHELAGSNVQEYHKLFPIPQRELLINPDLGQNQGY